MQPETQTATKPKAAPKEVVLDLYDIEVNIGGQIRHTVHKEGVTAAEIALIRAKHGNDSVLSFRDSDKIFKKALKTRQAEDRPTLGAEAERLKRIYGARAFAHLYGAGMANALPRVVEDLPAEIAMFDPPKEDKA